MGCSHQIFEMVPLEFIFVYSGLQMTEAIQMQLQVQQRLQDQLEVLSHISLPSKVGVIYVGFNLLI